jgi:hypothetical protein
VGQMAVSAPLGDLDSLIHERAKTLGVQATLCGGAGVPQAWCLQPRRGPLLRVGDAAAMLALLNRHADASHREQRGRLRGRIKRVQAKAVRKVHAMQ